MSKEKARTEFMGHEINKRVVNLGIGGVIELPGELLTAEARSQVTFQATATLAAVKHKFEIDGTVTESTILTLIADTFDVLGIAAAPPVPVQESLDDSGG